MWSQSRRAMSCTVCIMRVRKGTKTYSCILWSRGRFDTMTKSVKKHFILFNFYCEMKLSATNLNMSKYVCIMRNKISQLVCKRLIEHISWIMMCTIRIAPWHYRAHHLLSWLLTRSLLNHIFMIMLHEYRIIVFFWQMCDVMCHKCRLGVIALWTTAIVS